MNRTNLLSLVLVLAAAAAFAGAPQFRLFVTAEDLEKGKALGVSIDAQGNLSLAPATSTLCRASAPTLWCTTTDAAGRLLLGGGNPAQVIRLAAPGASAKADTTTIFSASEFAVFAMAVRGTDLFVATAPDGQIYRVSADGRKESYFKPEAKYIWALATGANGVVYAATGSPARLFRIEAAGRGSVIFECDEPHLRSLLLTEDGWLIAGSSGSGYVYRMRADGSEVSVLYDALLDEIVQVLRGPGGIVYAAAAGQALATAPVGEPPAEGLSADDGESLQEGGGESGRAEDQFLTPLAGAAGKKAKSALYRIAPNGQVRDLWSARADRIHSALLDKDGSLLIGTGERGRLYRVADDGTRTLLVELDALQLTALAADRQGNVLVAGSNPGVLTLVQKNPRRRGEYQSAVIDAKVPARWGAVSWLAEGGGTVKLATRAGNTGKPDKTWSAWLPVQGNAGGAAITSPSARFLQWRIEWDGQGDTPARVKRVQVSYLQDNVPPEITQITIQPAGDYFPDAVKQSSNGADDQSDSGSSSAATQGPGRKTYQKGAQSISWQARDENNDRLEYSLYYRMTGETAWRELAKSLQPAAFSWDSQTMPDGEYQVRVVASDGKSNPPALQASGEKISAPFIVDNTPPAIDRLASKKDGGTVHASFSASDGLSRLKEAWYAVDAGDWQLLFPGDGVADQRQEEYTIDLQPAAGRHTLTVKVVDAVGNIAFGRTVLGE